MVLGLEIEGVGHAETAKLLIILLAAGDDVLIGQVGQREHDIAVGAFDLADLAHDGCCVLAGLFHLGYLFRDLVLLGLEVVCLKNERAALAVETQDLGDLFSCVLALACQTVDDLLGVFLYQLYIKHGFCLSFTLLISL